MVIELAGLLAAAALLLTLITLEFRRAEPDTGQPTDTVQTTDTAQPARRRLLNPTVNRGILAVMWAMYLLLFLPRVLGLLT
jgi:hypothetical protein